MERRFILVTSEPLFAEVADVLSRPRIARRSRFTPEEVVELVAAMRDLGEVVPVSGVRGLCRDSDDDAVIETAVSGRADILVSGDHDLISDTAVRSLLADAGVRVLTVAELVAELDAGES